MKHPATLQSAVDENFKKAGWGLCLPAVLILLLFAVFFICKGGDFRTTYTQIQIPLFINLNQMLSSFPILEYNLTNIGNALVGLSLLSIFLHYAPRLWGGLINASLLSLGLTALLKKIFMMPRPARVIDLADFTILGPTLLKRSFPSGHSITIFIFITILLLAFMPYKRSRLFRWLVYTPALILAGAFIALSRVACGAHWPLDVLIGSTIGYLLAIVGIKIENRFNLWRWMENHRFKWIVLVIVLILVALMVQKIITSTLLFIDALALLSLVATVILLTKDLCSKRI